MGVINYMMETALQDVYENVEFQDVKKCILRNDAIYRFHPMCDLIHQG
jgi:hypothetical protein